MEDGTNISHIDVFELDWDNPPELGDLKTDYEGAKADRDTHIGDVEHWLNTRNIQGHAKRKPSKTKSSITPPMVRKQNEWRYPALTEPFLVSDDLITASPVTSGDVEAARQAEILLNNQLTTKMGRVGFMDEYIRTNVDEGGALLRTSWVSETGTRIEDRPRYETRYVADPDTGQLIKQEVVVGTEQVEVEALLKNHPMVEVVPYTNFTIDPTCLGKFEDAKFVIISDDTSLTDLKKSDIVYHNLDIVEKLNTNAEQDADHNPPKDDAAFEFQDKPRKKLIVHEYWGFWDIHGTGVVTPIVVAWVGNTIIRMEESPYPDKELPFVMVQYMPVRHSVFGEPDAALLEDNQAVAGAVKRGMIDLMARTANGQRATRKGALDSVDRRKRDRGEDFEVNATGSLAEVFYQDKFPEIPQGAHQMLAMENAEAESLTGIKAFSSGISGKSLGEQGVGIKSALDATSKREVSIQRRLAEGITQVCRKFMAMNAEFLSDEEVVRVTEEEFVTIRRDDLTGSIDIRLKISTPEADNEKATELAFMLQTAGPNMDPEESRLIRAEIARLRNMPALAARIEAYQPPPPSPEQLAVQQMEMAKVEAEIRSINAKAALAEAEAAQIMQGVDDAKDKARASATLEAAKVDETVAKTRDLENAADLKDLTYLEQESGVHHQRELDIIRAKEEAKPKPVVAKPTTK